MAERVNSDSLTGCRALVKYSPDGPEIVRMDDRLAESGPREGTLELIQSIVGQQPIAGPFGAHEASVYRFEDVLVVHCPNGNEGTIATFDETATTRSVDRLIEEVRSV